MIQRNLVVSVVAGLMGGLSFAGVFDYGSIAKTHLEQERLERFFQEAELRLPLSVRSQYNKPIQVKFASLGSSHLPADPCHYKGKLKLGSRSPFRSHQIILNEALLPVIFNENRDRREFACYYGNYYWGAVSTVLHEVAHAQDGGFRKKVGRLSGDPTFLAASGWRRRALEPPFLHEENLDRTRSVDPNEFKSPKESFAVNFEYFLLDPQYGCRHPILFDYFRRTFQHDPGPRLPCTVNTKVVISSPDPEKMSHRSMDLNPTRLYQVHFLYTSEGARVVSRWGHSMLRLVYCAPERAVMGPQCLDDVSHHLVLSFRANTLGIDFSPIEMFRKKYPSQLYIFSLKDIVQEYAKEQLRDVVSVPLLLGEKQKQDLVFRALEEYWGYQGEYRFVRNNCATELFHFLQASLMGFDFGSKAELLPMYPLGLLHLLHQHGMIDPYVPAMFPDGSVRDREEAITRGYLFPSNHPFLVQSFRELSFQVLQLQGMNLDQYLEGTTTEWRRTLFDHTMAQYSGPALENKKTIARFFLLEHHIFRTKRRQLLESIVKTEMKRSGGFDEEKMIKHGIIDHSGEVFKLPGYGIPLESEVAGDYEKFVNDQDSRLKNVMNQLELLGENNEAFAVLDRIQQTLSYFRNRMLNLAGR